MSSPNSVDTHNHQIEQHRHITIKARWTKRSYCRAIIKRLAPIGRAACNRQTMNPLRNVDKKAVCKYLGLCIQTTGDGMEFKPASFADLPGLVQRRMAHRLRTSDERSPARRPDLAFRLSGENPCSSGARQGPANPPDHSLPGRGGGSAYWFGGSGCHNEGVFGGVVSRGPVASQLN